jgi:hypothetical protein
MVPLQYETHCNTKQETIRWETTVTRGNTSAALPRSHKCPTAAAPAPVRKHGSLALAFPPRTPPGRSAVSKGALPHLSLRSPDSRSAATALPIALRTTPPVHTEPPVAGAPLPAPCAQRTTSPRDPLLSALLAMAHVSVFWCFLRCFAANAHLTYPAIVWWQPPYLQLASRSL